MIGADLIGQIRRAFFERRRPTKEIVRTLSGSRATVRKVRRPAEDRYLMTRRELTDQMGVLPGGRAAEQLVFDEPSTGASGSVAYDRDRSPFLPPNFPMPQERNYGEDTAQAVDAAVRTLVGAALQRVFAVLDRNRALLDRTSAALLATETLDEAEIEQLKRQIVGEGRESVPAAEIVA